MSMNEISRRARAAFADELAHSPQLDPREVIVAAWAREVAGEVPQWEALVRWPDGDTFVIRVPKCEPGSCNTCDEAILAEIAAGPECEDCGCCDECWSL